MAEARIRIEIDTESAKRKMERFDEERSRAKKKTDKADKKRAQRDKRNIRGGFLGAAAGAAVAARNPALQAIQARLKESDSTSARAVAMVAKATQKIAEIEAKLDFVVALASALEQAGPLGEFLAKPVRIAAGEIKKKLVPTHIIEQAKIAAGIVAPFASAGIRLDDSQIEDIAKFAAFQAQNKVEEELRSKAKIGKAVANVIAGITGVGG